MQVIKIYLLGMNQNNIHKQLINNYLLIAPFCTESRLCCIVQPIVILDLSFTTFLDICRVRRYTKVSKNINFALSAYVNLTAKIDIVKGLDNNTTLLTNFGFSVTVFGFILFLYRQLENDHKTKNKTKLDIDWGKKPRPLFTPIDLL